MLISAKKVEESGKVCVALKIGNNRSDIYRRSKNLNSRLKE